MSNRKPFNLATLLGLLVSVAPAYAQDAAAPPRQTAAELEVLVGPVALYPDELLGIILPASTYPLQVIQAARRLEAAAPGGVAQPDEDWHESIVALMNYPEIVAFMNEDLDWMWLFGDAVIYQQDDLMDAIQRFRARAYAAGNLRSDERQLVRFVDGIIEITNVEPMVIYVPHYEPQAVVVRQPEPVYHYYEVPYPVYYYPYPSDYAFSRGYFWGVTSFFGLSWHTHDVHVHVYDYPGHPYYARSYFPAYYGWRRGYAPRAGITIRIYDDDRRDNDRDGRGRDDDRRDRDDGRRVWRPGDDDGGRPGRSYDRDRDRDIVTTARVNRSNLTRQPEVQEQIRSSILNPSDARTDDQAGGRRDSRSDGSRAASVRSDTRDVRPAGREPPRDTAPLQPTPQTDANVVTGERRDSRRDGAGSGGGRVTRAGSAETRATDAANGTPPANVGAAPAPRAPAVAPAPAAPPTPSARVNRSQLSNDTIERARQLSIERSRPQASVQRNVPDAGASPGTARRAIEQRSVPQAAAAPRAAPAAPRVAPAAPRAAPAAPRTATVAPPAAIQQQAAGAASRARQQSAPQPRAQARTSGSRSSSSSAAVQAPPSSSGEGNAGSSPAVQEGGRVRRAR